MATGSGSNRSLRAVAAMAAGARPAGQDFMRGDAGSRRFGLPPFSPNSAAACAAGRLGPPPPREAAMRPLRGAAGRAWRGGGRRARNRPDRDARQQHRPNEFDKCNHPLREARSPTVHHRQQWHQLHARRDRREHRRGFDRDSGIRALRHLRRQRPGGARNQDSRSERQRRNGRPAELHARNEHDTRRANEVLRRVPHNIDPHGHVHRHSRRAQYHCTDHDPIDANPFQ